jgi:rsbT co-antagonist protein RsbR
MRVTQRQVVLALLALLVTSIVLVLGFQLVSANEPGLIITTLVALVATSGLLFAYWRGWEYARHATLILVIFLVSFSTSEPYLTKQFTLTAFIPPALALILAGPSWILGCAVAPILILLARAGWHGIYIEPITLAIYGITVGSLFLARLVTDTAQWNADNETKRAEDALAQSEAQKTEVAQKAEELSRQNEEQRRLIDLVATLETPAIALAEGVLLAPVVGHLDTRRAERLIERLLREVSETRALLVVLDIAGVPTVDTQVAHALLRAVQAVRLLGCDVTITGISASIATTMTELGINMAGVRTARTPQEALQQAVVAGPGQVNKN